MESGYSLFNPGGSIHFEIPAQIHEEDEAAEDARIKEIEIEALLTNAFDDLLDDDEDEGSIQHDSPTQSSIHSEGNISSNNLLDPHPFRHPNSNPARKMPIHSPYDVFEKQHGIAEETNEKFQQIDPASFNGDSSADFGSSGAESAHVAARNKEWEGQYYIDQWEDGHSDDQLQSGLLDTNLVNGLHQQQIQQKMMNGIDGGDSNEILAYQPYHAEAVGQNVVEFKKQVRNDNEEFEKQYILPGGESSDQIKLQQLQILYNARGREIQRLEENLETLRSEMNAEVGTMNNHLATINNENAKHAANLQTSQNELSSAMEAIAKLEGQLRASEIQLSSVTLNRNEVVQKLQSADSVIESLQVQIDELQRSENLNRARQNHATMLQSLSEKHNQEVYHLRSEITIISDRLQSKETEVAKVKDELNRLSHQCDIVKMALKQSENECQKLRRESKESLSAATSGYNDEVVLSLKEELAATQKELDLYVSAAKHSVFGQDFVSKITGNACSQSLPENDQLLTSLKSEVARSLSCLQSKKEQLQKLEVNYQTAQSKITALQETSESAKASYLNSQLKINALLKELQETKENCQKSDRIEEISEIKRENKSLKTDLNKARQHIEELSSSNSQLNKEIENLKEEIANLEQIHDDEKQSAVNDCRDACLQLHNDATRVKREEMERLINDMQRNNQQKVDALTQELDEVKTLYVNVCEEKNQLENHLLKEWNEAKTIEIEKLNKTWATEMERKIQLTKSDMVKLQPRNLHNHSMNEEEFNNKVQAAITKQVEDRLKKAKILWEKEQVLLVEEKASVKAKELIMVQQLEKPNDSSENAIDDYLEKIEELENRVKQTEDLYKQHLADLEIEMNQKKADDLRKLEERLSKETAVKLKKLQIQNMMELQTTVKDMEFKFQKEKQKLLSDLKSTNSTKAIEVLKKQLETVDLTTKQKLSDLVRKTEEDKSKAVKEAILKAEEDKSLVLAEENLRKDLLHQEKLHAIVQQKDKEKAEALMLLEQKLCAELESFLDVQKQRFLTALKNMQDSHAKEKSELQNSHEAKISQLHEDNKTLQQELLARKQQVNSDASDENSRLQSNVKSLESKCLQIESDMLEVVNDLKKQLRFKDVELENLLTKFNECQEKQTKLQDDCSHSVFQNEICTLKLQLSNAEEETNQYKLKVEEGERSYQNLVTRHSQLKEKVKRYHRHIHGKEKEFAVSLTKITEEHKAALEKVFSMKTEVIILLDHKLDELRRHIFQTYAHAEIPVVSSTYVQQPNPQKNPVERNTANDRPDLENGIKLLKDDFAQSIKNIHEDVMSYLEDCNHFASAKIQEEVAKASWLLSEHLGMPSSNEPSAIKKTSMRQTPVLSQEHVTSIGSRSQTPTPELVTNYSSGRGTMVDNPSSLLGTIEAARNADMQTFANKDPCVANISKPLKFWSSTPFSREFLDGTGIPLQNRPMMGLSKSSPVIPGTETFTYGSGKGAPPEKTPFSNYLSTIVPPTLTFSNVTWKSTENGGQNADISTFPEKFHSADKTAKFKSLAHQILTQSVQNSSPVPSLPSGSEERRLQYVAFNNNLSVLKNDFWHGVSGAGTKECQPSAMKSNHTAYL